MKTIIEFLWRNNVHTLLDVGANVGDWSSYVRHHIPDLKIFMLEANEECRPFLQGTGMAFDIACLSDSEKDVKLYKNPANAVCTGTSYYLENTEYYADKTFTLVKTKRLDDVVEAKFGRIPRFDYIKMDTQGSEADILRGGPKTIAAATYLQLELSLIPYNEGAPLKDEMITLLGTLGFEPVKKVEDHFLNGGSAPIQEDWIFARNGATPV